MTNDEIAREIFACMFRCTQFKKDIIKALASLEEEFMVNVTFILPDDVPLSAYKSDTYNVFFMVLDRHTNEQHLQDRYQIYDNIGIIQHYINCLQKHNHQDGEK